MAAQASSRAAYAFASQDFDPLIKRGYPQSCLVAAFSNGNGSPLLPACHDRRPAGMLDKPGQACQRRSAARPARILQGAERQAQDIHPAAPPLLDPGRY
jgi:hypothetical protein